MTAVTQPGERSQKILLIAYHFPPSAAVGGARIANLARCLPAFGWEPHILTIRERDIEKSDSARMQGLQQIPIVRRGPFPTIEGLLTKIWARRRRHARPAVAEGSVASGALHARRNQEQLSRRLRRYVLSFLELPDRERGWIFPATTAAIRQMRRCDITWYLTSCPPYSAHLVGLLLKILYGGKWVVDFRDPWMTTGSKRLYPTCVSSRRIESWLERQVIKRADLILFNVKRLRNAYRERYQHEPSEKFAYLPNALPGEATTDNAPLEKFARFTICYTGSFYLGRSPEPLYAALQKLIEDGRISASTIQIKLVGDCRDTNGVPTRDVAAQYGLEGAVEVSDVVPHAEALQLVRRSHLALLLAPNTPFQVPGKVYDYLAAGTRILALAEDGGTADVIRETDSGRALPPSDIDGIAEFIYDEMNASGTSHPADPTSLARLNMQALTDEFVKQLRRSETRIPVQT